jgi:tRNA(Arg) A34 adenosine deaminase TadA
MIAGQLHLTLPPWIHEIADRALYPTDDEKMALAIDLAGRNVAAATGGPFGAAVFDDAGRLLSVGVNRVLQQSCSLAHAEAMAYMLAQQRLQCSRLNESGLRITVATSAQPCCQCYGATFWAGVDRLLIGARREDVATLAGFDEGPLPGDWVGELERRGIAVVQDIQREAACAVLEAYVAQGGPRY